MGMFDFVKDGARWVQNKANRASELADKAFNDPEKALRVLNDKAKQAASAVADGATAAYDATVNGISTTADAVGEGISNTVNDIGEGLTQAETWANGVLNPQDNKAATPPHTPIEATQTPQSMLAENNSAQTTTAPKEPITPDLFNMGAEFLTKVSNSISDFTKASYEKGMAAIAEARDTIADQVIVVNRYTKDDKAHASKRIERIPEAKRENALTNINRMRELGLIDSDSAEVSLYKMHSAYNLLSGSSDMLVQQDGKSVKKEARDVLGTTDKDGKKLSHKQVLNKLVSGHLSDEELKIYADSVNKVETSVSTQGRIVANVADNHNRLAKNNSYQMGGDSGVNKTLSLKLFENSQNKIANGNEDQLAMINSNAGGRGAE